MAVIPPASTEAATFLTELRNSGNTLGVLVIGEAGSGKTTLIDNLQLNSQETAGFVTVYDTSGLETARAAWEKIEDGKHDKWVVILCIPLTETRMRASLIDSFKEYHDLGIDWTKTVFALTFADSIPTPKSVKRDPTYTPARYFEQRSQEWEEHIRRVFRDQICGAAITAAKMFPTTGISGDKLPNGVEWFDVAWSNIAVTAERQISGPELPSPLCIPIWKSWHVVFIISMVAGSFLGLFLGLCIGATFGAPERSQGIDFGTSVGGFLGALAGALIGLGGAKVYKKYIMGWKSGRKYILSRIVHERKDHLMLFREHVSRNAAGKGKEVLEGLWLNAAAIQQCFGDNPLNEEAAVQAGIIKWSDGTYRQPLTWETLLKAMNFAKIAQQHVDNLQKDLGL